MFLHLSYTISPVDIADSMEAAGSSHAIVVVLFDPAPCFMINERELMPFGMVWEKYMRDGRVRIRFSFVNDSSIDYDHNYGTYVRQFCVSMHCDYLPSEI